MQYLLGNVSEKGLGSAGQVFFLRAHGLHDSRQPVLVQWTAVVFMVMVVMVRAAVLTVAVRACPQQTSV